MTLLNACQSFCTSLSEAFGPTVTEVLAFAGLIALGWYKSRRLQAAVSAANEQASKAKTEARDAKLSLARIEGSLRPSAPTSAVSGMFEPVRIEGIPPSNPTPSMPDASVLRGESGLPAPPDLPTIPATPTSKRGPP